MNVFDRIDQARCEWDVLEHPFYERWSAGTLTKHELDVYAGQYRHAVVALAEASRLAAERAASDPATAEHASGLRGHALEEAAHVALWDEFAAAAAAAAVVVVAAAADDYDDERADAHADAADVEGRRTCFERTQQCAESWIAGEDLLEHLAVMYAIEASQPEIAKTKIDGLVQRYGYSEEGPATEYFKLHATLDIEHARQARELIERLMGADEEQARAQADRMVARARAALRGNWALLDGVEAHCLPARAAA